MDIQIINDQNQFIFQILELQLIVIINFDFFTEGFRNMQAFEKIVLDEIQVH